MSSEFANYTQALADLASLSTRVDAERAQIEHSTAARMDQLDRDWRSARAEFDSVADRRNRVQRDVSALCREIGPVPAGTTEESGPYRSAREIDAALDDLARRTERARKDWQWAQRYLERARTAATAPAPVLAPPQPPAPEPAQPESPRSVLPKPLLIGLCVLLLILIVVIALVV